jgi:cellulose 1,4-beta-cellobiosidase
MAGMSGMSARLAVVLLAGCASTPGAGTGAGRGETLTATTLSTPAGPSDLDSVPLPRPEGNPFLGADFYLDPRYQEQVMAAAGRATPELAERMKKVARQPTAIWIESVEDVTDKLPSVLADVDRQRARQAGKPVVAVFSIYDLPNRDCAAKASAGEFSIENDGERRYRTDFIDPVAAQFRAHSGARVVVILETDSLANLATNLAIPKCAAAAGAYRRSTAYAISALAMPNVSIYVEAAHSGWLGWAGNRAKIAAIYKDILTAAGGPQKIRGFFTNVSNFTTLAGGDGRTLEPSNPCPDELSYVRGLADSLRWAGITGKAFIIDTSRNGRGGIRKKWGSWCNVRGAGLGERPRAAPAPFVDAYFWVKPPGESDGTSDPSAPRFDQMCGSAEAAPGAPQAGQWFDAYFADLVRNANPPL